MASVYDLKPAFQNLLRPIVRGLAKIGVTPNQITLAALALSALAGAAILIWPTSHLPLLALPAVLLLRMGLNAIDGMLAREHQQTTVLGALLNEIGDVASDGFLYLPLAIRPEFGFAPIGFFFAAALTEVAGLAAVTVGAPRAYDGPMGKSDRALVIGALGLVIGLGVSAEPWARPLLWLATALGFLTTLRRCRSALRRPPEESSAVHEPATATSSDAPKGNL